VERGGFFGLLDLAAPARPDLAGAAPRSVDRLGAAVQGRPICSPSINRKPSLARMHDLGIAMTVMLIKYLPYLQNIAMQRPLQNAISAGFPNST